MQYNVVFYQRHSPFAFLVNNFFFPNEDIKSRRVFVTDFSPYTDFCKHRASKNQGGLNHVARSPMSPGQWIIPWTSYPSQWTLWFSIWNDSAQSFSSEKVKPRVSIAYDGECKVWTSVSGSQHAITANLDVSFRPLISIHAITANLDVSFRPPISIHAITANLDVSFRPLYALPLRGFKFQAECLYRR